MIAVPEAFVRATVGREGPRGAAWIARLPGIVEELAERWACVPDGGAVLHGGVGLVVPVRRAGGGPAVLKVSFPHPGNVHEPDAFAAWAGRGAVLLHERDDARFAMLLERAHPASLAEQPERRLEEVLRIAGRLSHRLAVPAPPGLPRLSARADSWEEELRKDSVELGEPLPRRVLDAALATVRELGRSQPELVVHGDLHPRNILPAEREPWLAVDPKGVAGDPAYDAGALLKACALPLVEAGDLAEAARRAIAVFAEAAGLDRVRVRRWVQFHAVQAAFWGRRHGFHVARGGAGLDPLVRFADRMAELLTDLA